MVLGLLVVLVVVVEVVGQLGHNILEDKLGHKWLGKHHHKLLGIVCLKRKIVNDISFLNTVDLCC